MSRSHRQRPFHAIPLPGVREDLTGVPLGAESKLRAILPDLNPRIRYSKPIVGNRRVLLRQASSSMRQRSGMPFVLIR